MRRVGVYKDTGKVKVCKMVTVSLKAGHGKEFLRITVKETWQPRHRLARTRARKEMDQFRFSCLPAVRTYQVTS